jgi:hypothetical protein
VERPRIDPFERGGRPALWISLSLLGWSAGGCYDRADRWLDAAPREPACEVGAERCTRNFERCEHVAGAATWVTVDDCDKRDLVCAIGLGRCAECIPNSLGCEGDRVATCSADGDSYELGETCDTENGRACRDGACSNLCALASQQRSNVGCEYWAVDLDNAKVSDSLNAAAQQFAVVVSNAQHDVTAEVTIEQDDSLPGDDNAAFRVAGASIPPRSLRVFRLGPREVDGSAPGEFNTGTHSAITRAAYRVRSDFPVVAYQFNPLANVAVFSNDASLLKPVEAVVPEGSGIQDAYVALGWPQTIASTDDPDTNFNAANPSDLRAFLTIVGTRAGTTVRVSPEARVLGAPGIPETLPGEELEVVLNPYDVLNLETDDFNADFTGSLIASDGPVIAFTGSEASDAPFFETLRDRRCCADHLEEQLDHVRTAGQVFVASVTPNRSRALRAAGAALGLSPQNEYFRVVATTSAGARIETSLAGTPTLSLAGRGDYADLSSESAFTLLSDEPVMLMSISASQEAGGVPRGLPGGDPSTLIVPPVEQFRSNYVFLTPDQYAFDFVRIVAPKGATIVFDGAYLSDTAGCTEEPAGTLMDPVLGETEYVVHTCQLAFPVVDPDAPAGENLMSGIQNDGVHVIEADRRIGVLVDGFDAFVSYAYAAGTELDFIVPL